jgi:transposase
VLLAGTGMVAMTSVTRELDDALWAQIAALLPRPRRRGQDPPLPYRTILDAILWAARTGTPWRDLPERFGPWKTVHATYYRWQQLGYWAPVLALLQATD